MADRIWTKSSTYAPTASRGLVSSHPRNAARIACTSESGVAVAAVVSAAGARDVVDPRGAVVETGWRVDELVSVATETTTFFVGAHAATIPTPTTAAQT